MVTDARGHEVPADSDMWGYREDMGLLSDSISDVRTVADQEEAEAAIADLVASDIDPTGTVWWLANPGGLYIYDGSELASLATSKGVTDAITAAAPRIAVGTTQVTDAKPDNAGTVTVTFPAGMFTAAPFITLGIYTSIPAERFPGHINKTATSFQLKLGYTGASSSASAFISWHAIQLPNTPAALFAAAAADPRPDGVVVCPTDGCGNQAIPIPVVTHYTDDDGTDRTVDSVQCGVCGTDITDTMQPIEES